MKQVRVFHNPHCSKSRQTLALLQQNKLDIEVIEYLQTPPSEAEREQILTALNLEPRELMRHDEPEYQALALDDLALNRSQLIAAMVAHPLLIQRPIVTCGNKAALGRPPEQVLGIL
ncbi:MAG: arsenate reductase (glutaredoxin) [Neisseriaceae bacterium]|nr:MAG: arsenate reductase (glutaredoxin) [Neisseriaceae bacterium]